MSDRELLKIQIAKRKVIIVEDDQRKKLKSNSSSVSSLPMPSNFFAARKEKAGTADTSGNQSRHTIFKAPIMKDELELELELFEETVVKDTVGEETIPIERDAFIDSEFVGSKIMQYDRELQQEEESVKIDHMANVLAKLKKLRASAIVVDRVPKKNIIINEKFRAYYSDTDSDDGESGDGESNVLS